MPATNARVSDGMGVKGGEFAFQEWTLDMAKKNFAEATVTDEKASSLASDIYHEARHAEQWHRMARFLAGKATPATKAAALKKWQDAYAAFIAAHAVYKALPEEADAFKTGDAVQAKYKAKP